MKFQVKALIAALALTASGVASATNVPSTGNGSLFLTIFDRTSNSALVVDTGYFYSTLNEIGTDNADSNFDSSNSSFSFDLSANAAFQSFIGGANLSTTYYNVFAGDQLGAGSAAGARGMITSYDLVNYPNAPESVAISKAPLVTAVGAFNQLVYQNNDPFTYFANDNNGNQGPTSIALLGGEMSLYQTVQKQSNGAGDNFFFNNTKVTFTNAGLLTISSVQTTLPVPEPESYALLALGLGVVAAAARRRKSAK
ncbi:PEP-CTERM sorting domain-containing protein [Methylophilus flavus]|jgi:hypothetical protein|uniref:PEP-CTERM sorting domain-containing protein n=1 Tax=Methylophilus flavus TaxID=640084 RepID=A0ABW3PJ59_9PROT